MRRVCGLVAAMVFFAPASAPAGPIGSDDDAHPPVEGVVTDPDWVSKPTGEQLYGAYPATAQALGLSGVATVDCAVESDGSVSGCRVIREDPQGLGFGSAALSLTPRFKMRPQLVDGVAVGGAHVKVPVVFKLPGAASELAPVAPSEAPRIAEPSAAALDQARKLAAIAGPPSGAPLEVTRMVAGMNRLARALPKDSLEAATQSAAAHAYEQSLEASKAAFADARALALAQTFTPEELRAITAFFESPAGKAWNARSADVDALEAARTSALLIQARRDAAHAVCDALGDKAPVGCKH